MMILAMRVVVTVKIVDSPNGKLLFQYLSRIYELGHFNMQCFVHN